MKKIYALLASMVMILGLMAMSSPAQAHTWYPADGSGGYTSLPGCDGYGLEGNFPFNDGRVCYRVWYYDHGDHLHIDHINVFFKANVQGGGNDYLVAVRNQDYRVYAGYCSTSFPNCYNNGEVTGPSKSDTLPNVEDPNVTLSRSVEHKVGKPRALVVIDYVVVGVDGYTGQTTAYAEQEEIKP